MHKLTKIPPLYRYEIWNKYSEKMRETKGKNKEVFYGDMATYYHVHRNTIRKVVQRARKGDFTIHKSTISSNLAYQFHTGYITYEKRLYKRLNHLAGIHRYEKSIAGEMVHIDVHKIKNIKGENPKKKKYLAGVIDDATRLIYTEVISNKKAKTLADFMRRAYAWFQKKGIAIRQVLSDNGLEFTTHNQDKQNKTNQLHSFEALLIKLRIIHKYTKVRRPQTNGKIERWWRIFNDNFWYKNIFTNQKDFNMKFKDWLVYYNLKRPHGGIEYMTPMEKLEKLLEEQKVCI